MVIAPRVHRVRAPNASAMTLDGTNTYVLDFGEGTAVVVDPGPTTAAHIDAIRHEARSAGLAIVAIAVTHGHPDHAPGAAPLAAATGAPVYGHAAARFPHDRTFDGTPLRFGTREMLALDAPGHLYDHVVFATDDDGAMFTGDVVVGHGTVVIAPPHGDMRAYQQTLAMLRNREPAAKRLYGGHGEPVDDPRAKFDEYIAHRIAREDAILAELRAGPKTIPELVRSIYCDVAPLLWPAAARQIDAYLIALEAEGRIAGEDLGRAPTQDERAILTPDLSALVSKDDSAVIRAELGLDVSIDRVKSYALREG